MTPVPPLKPGDIADFEAALNTTQVIDLERMGKPENVLREQGMLCNPRTPRSVVESVRPVSAAISVVVAADGSNAAEVMQVASRKSQVVSCKL